MGAYWRQISANSHEYVNDDTEPPKRCGKVVEDDGRFHMWFLDAVGNLKYASHTILNNLPSAKVLVERLVEQSQTSAPPRP